MALDRLTWRASSVDTFTAGASVADILAAIKTLIDAEVAANPTTYQWSVSDYDAGNGTLELKPKSSNVANMRVLLFGGRVPNAAATHLATNNATYIYCLCAPTAGTTGPDNDYASGNPYNVDNTSGCAWGTEAILTFADSVRYYETAESIVIVLNDASASSDTVYVAAGVIAEHPSDGRVYGVATQGAAKTLQSDFWSAVSNADRALPLFQSSCANTNETRLSLLRSSKPADCFLILRPVPQSSAMNHMRSQDTNTNYYAPLHVANASDQEYVGVMRQIAFGNNAALGATQVEGGAEKAYAVSSDPFIAREAFWLVN